MKRIFYRAFSLVEMLVTLITVSLLLAALTPVITKKLKSNTITIGTDNSKMEFDADCTKWEDCVFCTPEQCSLCAKDCMQDEYVNTPPCLCAKCNTKHPNCIECTSKNCKRCAPGYGITAGYTCNKCLAGTYSDGTTNCIDSPVGNYVPNDGASSPTKCPIGQYQDETKQTSCKTCLAGTYQDEIGQTGCKTCEIDYMCTGGANRTQCALNQGAIAGSSACNPCPNNCADCQIPGNCLRCDSGYYLSNKLCYSCDSGYFCDGTITKTQCSSKFENCTACTNTACTTCADGFLIENGACVSAGIQYTYTGNKSETPHPDGRKIIKLTSSGKFTVTRAPSKPATILVVGGGGGGASHDYGGFGGGGVVKQQELQLQLAIYNVTIGSGGSGGAGGDNKWAICNSGSAGGTSKFDTISASGGGGGQASNWNGTSGGAAGSGSSSSSLFLDGNYYGGRASSRRANGGANTGKGGGGGSSCCTTVTHPGGNGGSGVVIVVSD